jgi:DNA polymerase elongation subunit (family B)
MLENVSTENVLFIDIETAPAAKQYDLLPEPFRELWHEKFQRQLKEGETIEEQFFNNAGIYAEFGKVICISAGMLKKDDNGMQKLRIRSFAGNEEHAVLSGFADMLNKHYSNIEKYCFCGHNINEFDIPYLCRRMLVNGIGLPVLLDIGGLKPWQIKNIDTMQHWKFGDYKSYTSLKLLAALFNIPTPKDDISGKDVGRVYWHEENLERIKIYCQKDVLTVAQLLLRFRGLPLLTELQVEFIN